MAPYICEALLCLYTSVYLFYVPWLKWILWRLCLYSHGLLLSAY